jgi:hypothetical protein
LLNDDVFQKNQLTSIIALFALVLILSGIVSIESQCNINVLIQSTLCGRDILIRKKLLVCLIISTIIWFIVYGAEFYALLNNLNSMDELYAPVQNLSMFNQIPFNTSIICFLIIIYVLKLFIIFAIAIFVMAISSIGKNVLKATFGNLALFVLPSILYIYFNVDVLEFFSFCLPLSAFDLIIKDFWSLNILLLYAIITAAAIIVYLILQKQQKFKVKYIQNKQKK